MKYTHLFQTDQQLVAAYNGSDYIEPWVALSKESETVTYNKTEEQKLLGTPLTFEIISDGNITWKVQNNASLDNTYTKTIEYKKNDGDWTEITSSTGGTSLSVASGDTVQFRGNNQAYATSSTPSSAIYTTFSGTTAGFNVEGNIMSLIAPTGFGSLDTLASSFTFCYLFQDCTGLTDVSKLVLPATTLADDCYYGMFQRCTSLATVPESLLPATTLANNCYYSMFQGCTGLTSAPALPATTLASYCYCYMFVSCKSLTTAPTLPATTLANNCYYGMFQSCTSLATVPESLLPATTLTNYCYCAMFAGCTSLTTLPALPATALTSSCYYQMFSACTSLTTIPETLLPATTLADKCYQQMFGNCGGLTTIPEKLLPATTLAASCYTAMFYSCATLTNAPELPALTLTAGCYQQMFYNCRSLNYIKAMFTTTPGYSYTSSWVYNVASSGTFVKNSAAAWNVSGNNGIPNNWTVQNAS